jgi:hypothetical protein
LDIINIWTQVIKDKIINKKDSLIMICIIS